MTWGPQSANDDNMTPFATLIPDSRRDRFQFLGHDRGNDTFVFTLSSNKLTDKKDDKKDTKPETPSAPQPKIRQETIVVGSFEFGDDTVEKIKPIGDWFDYTKLHAWYKKLPEATKNKIMNGEPPGGKKIVMTGFTDNVGNEHMNLDLGKRRALAVAKKFETISGVSWSKFVATPSDGEQDVREENKSLEKKEPKHRRVEVVIHIQE